MTHTALTAPGATPNLAVVEVEAKAEAVTMTEILNCVKTETIRTPDDFAFMSRIAQNCKADFNRIETKRKSITGPINDSLRIINSMFAQATKPLQEAENICRSKINAYVVADRAAQVAAMQAQAAVPAGPDGAFAGVGAVPESVVPEVKGISTKIVLSFEIVNPELVERQFCSPDPKKIQAFLDNGGLAAIPGVRFFDTAKTIIRGTKVGT